MTSEQRPESQEPKKSTEILSSTPSEIPSQSIHEVANRVTEIAKLVERQGGLDAANYLELAVLAVTLADYIRQQNISVSPENNNATSNE